MGLPHTKSQTGLWAQALDSYHQIPAAGNCNRRRGCNGANLRGFWRQGQIIFDAEASQSCVRGQSHSLENTLQALQGGDWQIGEEDEAIKCQLEDYKFRLEVIWLKAICLRQLGVARGLLPLSRVGLVVSIHSATPL